MAEKRIFNFDGNGGVTEPGNSGAQNDAGGIGTEQSERVTGNAYVNPADARGDNDASRGNDATSAGQPRRRGRPPGSGNKPGRKPAPSNLSVDGLNRVIMMAHVMLAEATKVPELVMSEPESKSLAAASIEVLKFYPGIVPDEKTLAWINLGMVASTIYGTRFAAMRIRIAREKRRPNVVNLRGENEQPN